MAEGGATYTVNIELATRQFSQDLRDLKNKIKNELGKSVKVATGGSNADLIKEKTLALRREQEDKRQERREKYKADQKRAQLIEKQRLIERVNKLQEYGYTDKQVKKLRTWAGEIDNLARGNPQAAQQKIKDLRTALDAEEKILDKINEQAKAEKKLAAETKKKAEAEKKAVDRAKKVADAKKKEADARRAERLANKAEARENRQRKGPHGIRMHGPVDRYGNPIWIPGPKVPKSGAALPIDLGRKDTGKFAIRQERLLRRRNTLTALADSFKGAGGHEVEIMRKNIKALADQYERIINLRIDMKSRGSAELKRSGYWGEWKDGKLVTKDHIGKAGTITRELEQLESATELEEARGKQLKLRIKAEKDFLSDKHRIEKLLAKFDAKGVSTSAKRLKLEKAITAQDQNQLTNLLRETEIEQARMTGKSVSGSSGGGGRRRGRGGGSTIIGGPSVPLSFASNGQLLRGSRWRRDNMPWGRMGQSAMISGGFPILFGQNPAIAALGAAGGALGEAVTPGGGFAGGIAATAIGTAISGVIASLKGLSETLNPLKFNADKAVESLTFLNGERAREIRLLEKTRGSHAALIEVRAELEKRYGSEGLTALENFDSGMDSFVKNIKKNWLDMKVGFAEFADQFVNEKGVLTETGLKHLGESHPFVKQYREFEKKINETTQMGPGGLVEGYFTAGATGRAVRTDLGRQKEKEYKEQQKLLTPAIITAGIEKRNAEMLSKVNDKFKEQVTIKQGSLDIDKEVLKLRNKGINPAIAKTMVNLTRTHKTTLDLAKSQVSTQEKVIKGLEETENSVGKLSEKDQKKLDIAKESLENYQKQVDAIEKANEGEMDKVKSTMEQNMELERQLALHKQIGSAISSGLVKVLKDAFDETKNINEAMNQLVNTVSDKILDYGISYLLANSGLPGAKKFFGFADGGRPPKGKPSIVGERGPELFVPDGSGTIIPNHDLGGSTNVVVNVDASGTEVRGDKGQAEELGGMLAAAVQAEIVAQQRPGGLLASTR